MSPLKINVRDTAKSKFSNKSEALKISLTEKKYDQIYQTKQGGELLLGAKKKSKVTRRQLIVMARKAVQLAAKNKYRKIYFQLNDLQLSHLKSSEEELAELLAVNFEMANYQFFRYKKEPKEGFDSVREVEVLGEFNSLELKSIKKAFQKGSIIGQEVNQTRELANIPGGDMTPQLLLKEAQRMFAGSSAVKLKVLDKKQLQKIGAGGILSVAQGSTEEPKFIILEYQGGNKQDKPIVLAGKAVTFDTGGVNLKPSEGMGGMHMDMSGGAAVLGALAAAERLKIKRNIVALVPAVENMASGTSYRPGDIIKMLNGKTVEIGNTDAEGRIILADALTYAERYNPKLVVDVATLTGAAMVTFGYRATALFTSEGEKHHPQIQAWGEQSGDYVWPMPLWEEYVEEVKGVFADLSNTGKFQRWGGSNTAAAFLWQFAKKYPWIHLDIAPRMTSVEGEYLAKGAAGAPVRLLVKMLEEVDKL
jgi:leucyl aminopeptidase